VFFRSLFLGLISSFCSFSFRSVFFSKLIHKTKLRKTQTNKQTNKQKKSQGVSTVFFRFSTTTTTSSFPFFCSSSPSSCARVRVCLFIYFLKKQKKIIS